MVIKHESTRHTLNSRRSVTDLNEDSLSTIIDLKIHQNFDMIQIPQLIKQKIKDYLQYFFHQEWMIKISQLNKEYRKKIIIVDDIYLTYNGDICLFLDSAGDPFMIESHRERIDSRPTSICWNRIRSFTYEPFFDRVYKRRESIPMPHKYRYSSTKDDLRQSMRELNSGHLLCGLKPIYPFELLD